MKHSCLLVATLLLAACGRSGVVEPKFTPEPVSARRLAYNDALMSEHAERKCQMFAWDSYGPPWIVYMIQADAQSYLVCKEFSPQLWKEIAEINRQEDSQDEKPLAALTQIGLQANSASAPISEQTANLLEAVWLQILDKPRLHPLPNVIDSTTYRGMHPIPGKGLRSGYISSVGEPGNWLGEWVGIALQMRELAKNPEEETEQKLQASARALLEQLKELGE